MFWLLDKLFERFGRKYALMDWTGDVIGFRYYPLFIETPGGEDDHRPNVYLHHLLDPRGLDGTSGMATVHHHPWDIISVIVRGGYKELRNGKDYQHTAPAAYKMAFDEKHAVLDTVPGTLSLFFHGKRKREWEFSLKPCEKVCDRCAKDFGRCEKELNTLTLKQMVNGEASRDGKKWRGQTWEKVTPEFYKKAERRKAALARMGAAATVQDPMKYGSGDAR